MTGFTDAELEALGLSLRVAAVATLGLAPFAMAAAYALGRWRFPGHTVLNVIVHLPLVLPPVVTGLVLLVLFGRTGPIGRLLEQAGIVFAFDWTGAALASATMALPLMVRPMRLAFEAVDPRLEKAAQTLGAPPWRRFLTVTLPLASPGVLAGAALAFAKAFGEFGATITFVGAIEGETRTLPLYTYGALQTPAGGDSVLRAALLSTTVAVGALAISEWLARRIDPRRGLS